MTKKTLKLREPSEQDAVPAIKKKGRGWEISEKRLDALHERARDMRRHSSPAHKALAEKFAGANLGRFTFKRYAVIGSAIVDFGCHNLGLALAIDEEGEGETLAPQISRRRDKSLEAVGMRVLRLKAADILTDIDAVLEQVGAAMREQRDAKTAAARAHRDANPKQHYARPNRKKFDNARD